MTDTELKKQYLELLKKSLLNELYLENEARLIYTFHKLLNKQPIKFKDYSEIAQRAPALIDGLRAHKLQGLTTVLGLTAPDGKTRQVPNLRNVTELSHTMIGRRRLENVQFCVETALEDGIPGDLIETGIWRGGTCIFMQGLLMAYGTRGRTVWAADSFRGVPPPSLPQDEGFDLSPDVLPVLAVSLEEVKELFERYGLLNDNVRFLEGWFKDTLAAAPIDRLAVLRLDGDLYESTMDALVPLYDKVSPGGFVIVDDYGSCPPCKQAIDDFRRERGIVDEMHEIDPYSVYWRKP
jgi:O-methyltransferase